MVAKLLIWIRLVTQQNFIARLDEADRPAGHQQLGLQRSITGQYTHQCLPGPDSLTRFHLLQGDDARGCSDDGNLAPRGILNTLLFKQCDVPLIVSVRCALLGW